MGIDACMFVKHHGDRLTTDDVRALSGDLVAALGTSRLWVMRPAETPHCPEGRHALELVDVYHQDGPTLTPEQGEQFIEVHLWGRYYGPGYERGDWPTIDAICRWFEHRLPGCEVWYGGDSSGVEAEWMSDIVREEMWEHFATHGHDPYVLNRQGHLQTADDRICGFCRRLMEHYGFGKNYEAWRCNGCGLDEETRDGGTTWTPREKERA
jgi:hypothetical protein